MLGLAEACTCRRVQLLAYFGEKVRLAETATTVWIRHR